jgi:hypothetical protein
VCPKIVLEVEDALRSNICDVSRTHWNNIRFYVAMLASMRLIDSRSLSAPRVAGIDASKIEQVLLEQCIGHVSKAYNELGGTNKVAKGAALLGRIMDAW